MTSKQVYWLTIALLIFLGGGIVASSVQASKILSKESDKLVDLKLQNRLLDDQQNALIQAKKSIKNYEELDKIAQTVLPQDKDQAKAVREIVKISGETGIKLASITFPNSTLGTEKPAAPSADPAAPKAAPAETQVKPVSGIPGVFQMEINIQSETSSPIDYSKFIDFLGRLEKNRRTAQVTSISVIPNESNRNLLTFTMTLNLYIKP